MGDVTPFRQERIIERFNRSGDHAGLRFSQRLHVRQWRKPCGGAQVCQFANDALPLFELAPIEGAAKQVNGSKKSRAGRVESHGEGGEHAKTKITTAWRPELSFAKYESVALKRSFEVPRR